ncbi:MAG: hypothetical protein WAV88_01005 [Candidatus Nanopelagicales bacterium]
MAPPPSPVAWTVLRAVIASLDDNRRVSVGRLGLSTRHFVVAAWTPFIILDPAPGNETLHGRAVDAVGRLQLRPVDVEVLGASDVLVALTPANRLVLASATSITEIALCAATKGLEMP